LAELEHERLFDGPLLSVTKDHFFCESTLNTFASKGKAYRIELRQTLQRIFGENGKLSEELKEKALFSAKDAKMHLPVFIRDYTDFYSSKNHAYNVGVMVRGPENALQPNWLHLPVGYHGRASSIVVDGTPIRRPRG
jgi:fumarylacetoacetase